MASFPPSDPLGNRGAFAGPVPRTVYIGGIDATTTAAELCEYIKGGMLDNIKVMPEKNCAFVTFVFPEGAQIFFEYASQGFLLKGRQVKVGWGKPSNVPQDVLSAAHRGATRNVYLGNLDDTMSDQRLYEELSYYGQIESILFLAEKRCAFVSFTSLLSALKVCSPCFSVTVSHPTTFLYLMFRQAVDGMMVSPMYRHYRINFGKDNCAKSPFALANGSTSRAGGPRGYPAPPLSLYPPSYSSLGSAFPQETKMRADQFPGLDQYAIAYGTY